MHRLINLWLKLPWLKRKHNALNHQIHQLLGQANAHAAIAPSCDSLATIGTVTRSTDARQHLLTQLCCKSAFSSGSCSKDDLECAVRSLLQGLAAESIDTHHSETCAFMDGRQESLGLGRPCSGGSFQDTADISATLLFGMLAAGPPGGAFKSC